MGKEKRAATTPTGTSHPTGKLRTSHNLASLAKANASFSLLDPPTLLFIVEIMNVTLVNLFGGAFFGNLLTALCFGVLTIQTSSYYHAFPNDGRPVKLVVGFLWALEAFQLACCTRSLYWYIITNYNNPLALGWSTWEFSMYQVSGLCTSVTVPTFMVYRVYSLSANIYVGVLVQCLVLVQFGFGAAAAVRGNTVREFQAQVKDCMWLIMSSLTIQATTDIVIATCLCLLLRRQRTGFHKTDSVINRMILYTMSTGLATSVLACFLLGMFAQHGPHFSVLVLAMPLGGFYSVTLLSNLHMRKSLRARLSTPTPLELISYSIKKRTWQGVGDGRVRLNAYLEGHQATRINIDREVASDDVDQ
ncbi:hypothetical protein BS47DRAFT_1488091 [Hydnum rufescens UP504]|uniref:DUF6534 domain-containing protein n=1 Tax=Hydnum rufescens UP504 TaxID=1448309 RepID=A0A9P6AP82_9AGAM|nr:hypothetical protein BS47DRAFT_1488091 [Hydnum rufescens UP504]